MSSILLPTSSLPNLKLLSHFLLIPPSLQRTSSHRPLTCSLSPPTTREEAISQVKSCLSTTLQKPLNNPIPLPTRKLKKQRQPRYRVEIPVADDSADSLTQLALELFSDTPVTKKGTKPTILILWPHAASLDSARRAFAGSAVVNSDLGSWNSSDSGAADFVVFMSPESSQLGLIKVVSSDFDPRPVVLFNPKWGFDEERDFSGGLGGFEGSFDVVYSFMGLEVREILSRRTGVVFKSGEGWMVMVEDEGNKGEINLMAANSPVTKSMKFIRDFASNLIA